ncbi:hypothetical protein FACS1894182_02970 [Bacteroidia bacterium]|nr:hypothetical protein FACS1894182_02970 [Bacteroidia bacterium]
MKMRDVIAHHYFEIDADVVFDTLQQDIKPLLQVIIQIKENMNNEANQLRVFIFYNLFNFPGATLSAGKTK